MTQSLTSELFFVSLVVLLLVLMVLMVLCWILRHSTSRNLTELKISAGRPSRTLTIRTQSDQTQLLLDRLLDRVFLQVEPGAEPGDELEQEPGAEPGDELVGECGSLSGSDPEVSSAAFLPSRAAVNINKLWKWISSAHRPPPATPPPPPPPSPSPPPPAAAPPPPPPTTNQDQSSDLGPQQLDTSQPASLSLHWEEEQHDESEL